MPSNPPIPPKNSLPTEWDQAEVARKIADSAPSADAPARKRKVRKRILNEEAPTWDAKVERASHITPDDVIEHLDETLQNKAARSQRRRRQGVHVREVEYTPGKNLIIAFAILTILGIAGAITYAVLSNREAKYSPAYVGGDIESFMKGEADFTPIAEPAPPEPDSRPNLIKIDSQKLVPVRQCIESFLTANSIDEKLAFVRPTPNVREHMELMADHPIMRAQIEPTFGSGALGKGNFIYAEVLEAGIGYRGAIVEINDRTALLDFDSFIGFSEIDWKSFEAGISTPETEIRALIKLLPVSNSDSPSLRRAVVRDPSQSFTIYATIEIFGIPEKFASILTKSQQQLPYVVTVRALDTPAGTASTTPEITSILAAGWFKEIEFITGSPSQEATLSF